MAKDRQHQMGNGIFGSQKVNFMDGSQVMLYVGKLTLSIYCGLQQQSKQQENMLTNSVVKLSDYTVITNSQT